MGSWSRAETSPLATGRAEQAFMVGTLKMRISDGGKSIPKDYCAWPIMAKLPIAVSTSPDPHVTRMNGSKQNRLDHQVNLLP